MKPPTQAMKDKYIRQGGVRCLFCGSEQIEGGAFECDAGVVWQEVHCLSCGEYWNDLYKLVEVQNPDWEQTKETEED